MDLQKNEITYNESLLLYKSFQPASLSNEILSPEKVTNADFYDDFPGNLIQKPCHTNRRFYESKFNSANGAYSKFNNCNLFDCLLSNCDLRYRDFTKCEFKKDINKTNIVSCNFNYSNFIYNTFETVKFSGTSFRQMMISDCLFIETAIVNSSFEETIGYTLLF